MVKLKSILLLVSLASSSSAFAEMDVLPGSQPPAQSPPPAAATQTPSTVSASPAAVSHPEVAPVNSAPSGFYYYCESLKLYYPAAPSCPESWVAIPLSTPLPTYYGPSYLERRYETAYIEASSDEVSSRPNAFTVELFGRALLYSVDYDRQFTDYLALGVGFSAWDASTRWDNYQATVTVVPLYANFYFSKNASRGFLSAGADLIKVSQTGYSNDNFENSGVAGTVGAGYEFRDHSGFLVRLSAFLIIGRSTDLSPSVGLGIAF